MRNQSVTFAASLYFIRQGRRCFHAAQPCFAYMPAERIKANRVSLFRPPALALQPSLSQNRFPLLLYYSLYMLFDYKAMLPTLTR